MARRISRQSLAALFLGGFLAGLLLARAGHGAEPVRIRYSFDDGVTATGPDTFTVFRNAKGNVQLSTAFHVSGYHSVELRDVAGDHNFPELQGFFPERRGGRLAFHFALLTTDPRQELNVALAGPGWFHLGEDGIAFWLKIQDGVLRHVSDSIPKKLINVKPFTWYRFDVDYDLARGRYDLIVSEEGNPAPVVALKDQPNGSSQPGAAVNVFSFIGDLDDRSNVVYYIDDFVLTSDGIPDRRPFVAPGRRKFFVDLFAEQVSLFKRLRKPGSPLACPAVLDWAELGLSSGDISALKAADQLDQLAALLDPAARAVDADAPAPSKVRAAARWKSGCKALEAGRAQDALAAFEEAARQSPEAGIFDLSRALALVALKRWQALDDLLVPLHSRWGDDPRYALVSALAGAQRGDLAEARAWLDPVAAEALRKAPSLAPLAAGDWSDQAVAAARAARPEDWKRWLALSLASEQRFHLAMFEDRTAEARDYAIQMAQSLKAAKVPAGAWLERAGDAAFTRRDLDEARQLYGQAKLNGAQEVSVLLKLADVHFLLGDLAAEKALREAFYGSLDPR
jgi:tetratricopeptide (TPR) repeat protein